MRPLDGVLWVSMTQWKPFRDVSFVKNFVYSTAWAFAENRMLVAFGGALLECIRWLGAGNSSWACMRQFGSTCVRQTLHPKRGRVCLRCRGTHQELETWATGGLDACCYSSRSGCFATEVYPPHGTLGVAQRMGVSTRTFGLACHYLDSFFGRGSREGDLSGLRAFTKTSYITVLFKKGDATLPENYRPITLSSILYKLFARIVSARLRKTLEAAQSVDQAGFRIGFACEDHLQPIVLSAEACSEFNTALWVCAVDFEKAFDSVEQSSIWKALASQGVGLLSTQLYFIAFASP